MSSIQYGTTYQMVQRGQGNKQQVRYELEQRPWQEERLSRVNPYELKMNRFSGAEPKETDDIAPPKASHPERKSNVNPLDLNKDGVISNFEVKQAQSNQSQLSAGAMALLKKIVEHQSTLSNDKQTRGLDTNNGHTQNTQAHMARMDRPAFVGNSFSA